MGIVEEDLEKVKKATDIVELISEQVQLKRVGRRWVGLCPFHSERSPSFSVNQELGFYYCFGCGAKGDAISFVRETANLEFVSAVEQLADKAGIELRMDAPQDQQARKKRQELLGVVNETADFFHARLLNSPQAADARSYLRSRGFTGEDVRKFKIGWAGPGGQKLQEFLDEDIGLLVDAGLVAPDNPEKEFFFRRIMFPICSPTGDPVAFGGRILPDGKGPKYKNSPGGVLYDKSRVLYGLNWAKSSIVEKNSVIICEGYTDVIGLSAMGVENVVAPCGTALTEDHVKLLSNYTDTFILMFDADQAGRTAAERLLEWEKKHQLNLLVVQLPDGMDPGEISRTNPELMGDVLEKPIPFLKFRISQAIKNFDVSSAEGKARAADAAILVINDHPDEIIRDQYIMEVATHLGVPSEKLRGRKPGAANNFKGTQGTRGTQQESDAKPLFDPKKLGIPLRSPEVEALRVLVDSPETFAPITHEVLFTNDTCLTIYQGLKENDWSVENLEEIFSSEITDFVLQLAVQEAQVDGLDVFQRLVENAATQTMHSLTQKISTEQTMDDNTVLEWAQNIQWLKSELDRMRDPSQSPDAAPNIFEWLIEYYEKEKNLAT